MPPSWSSAPLTLDRILAAVPPDLSWEKLRTYHRIAFNVDNITQLLQHSPGLGCPSPTTERHIPGPNCPTPDVPLPRAAILPLIEQTLDLCRIWRAQNLEAIDMIDEIEESMTKLGEYAGDNMVALELSLLKATEQYVTARSLDKAQDAEGHQGLRSSASHHSMPSPPSTPPVTIAQKELIQKRLSRMWTPDINISIPSTSFRNSTLRGMEKSELKQRLEEDMLTQGINAPIQDSSFRGQWAFVYVRFFELEDAAMVRVLWKPSLFGNGAFIKTTRSAGIPPFLSPTEEAKGATTELSKAAGASKKKTREVTVVIPNNQAAKSRLANIEGPKLKTLIEGDLKDQGIEVSIAKCKKSPACTHIRVWTTTVEEVPLLLGWKPNLPQYLGKGSGVWVRT